MTSYAIPPKSRQRVLRAFENQPRGGARRKNQQPRKQQTTIEGYPLSRDPYAPGISRAESDARFKAGPSGRPTAMAGLGPPKAGPGAPKPQRSNPGFGNWRSTIWAGQTPNRRKRRAQADARLLP